MPAWNPNTPTAGATPAQVEAASTAAIDASATGYSGSLFRLVNYDIGGGTGTHTGATSYEIISGQVDKRTSIMCLILSSDKDIVWSIWSDNAFPVLGDHSLAAGIPFSVTGPGQYCFLANQSDPIVLRVNDATATVQITCKVSFGTQ